MHRERICAFVGAQRLVPSAVTCVVMQIQYSTLHV